jgi:Ni/Co efflux regulator RcnB
MKKFLLSILALTLVTLPAKAEDQDKAKEQKRRSDARAAQRQYNAPKQVVQPKVQQNNSANTQFQNRNKPSVAPRSYVPKSYTPEVQAKMRNNSPKFTPPNQDAAVANVPKSNNDWQNSPRRRRDNPNAVQPSATPVTTTQSNTTVPNSNWRNRNTTNDNANRNWENNNTQNRNWQNNNSNVWSYDQARRNHRRDRHDRSWWRNHYSRIALFAGGYYYWNSGYWYPAYGYDPYYSSYTYDEPIYGYGDLQPGQVIANVQSALQEQGYYRDAVDGLIGPNTRAALSAFQRDQGLPITAAIDGPTLQALGLN